MTIWQDKIIISPSLICLDLCNLQNQVEILEQSGVKMLHVDILDGHFSPSMPLGLETIKQLRNLTSMDFDVHIMATNNDYFVNELIDIGVQQIVFHIETEPHIDNQINKIRNAGIRAGVAMKPTTPLSELEYILEKCDAVLLMLINPGYASSAAEKQVPYAKRKIYDLKNMIDRSGYETIVALDGRISKENITEFGGKYANLFVAGSTCIKKDNLEESVAELNTLKEKILLGAGNE